MAEGRVPELTPIGTVRGVWLTDGESASKSTTAPTRSSTTVHSGLAPIPDYEIDGDTLSLSPVSTKAMVASALANPFEFTDAGWSVSVAYPGETWKRVDCSGWC